MKKLMTILFLAFALCSQASTVEEARALFAKRGEGVENAKKAADIYYSLASNASGLEKANLLIGAAEATYFVGIKTSAKKEKIAIHKRGYETSEEAKHLYEEGNASKRDQAISLYWFASNIGKWGEAIGILRSLEEWGKRMKPALEEILALDDTIQDYGVYRVLGLGYIKVPYESKAQGLEYLAKAYSETLSTIEVDGEELELSYHVNNTVFLLEGLIKGKQVSVGDLDFCDIFDSAQILWEAGKEDESIFERYNPNLVPETKEEFENFFTDEKNIEYFEEKC